MAIGLYGDGIRRFVEKRDGVIVVGASTNIADAARQIRDLSPDVVLVDRLLDQSVSLVRRIRVEVAPQTKIIVLAVPAIRTEIEPFLQAGVDALVHPDEGLERLANHIEAAVHGDALLSPRAAGVALRSCQRPHSDGVALYADHGLTPAECRILMLLTDELSNKQIAQRLVVEVGTVKNHLHHIYDKLEVASRREAAAWMRMQHRALSAGPELVRNAAPVTGADDAGSVLPHGSARAEVARALA
jgi:DNA-binding NarL/FixJ family response regulator